MKLLKTQAEFDRERVSYDVVFPDPLPPEQVQSFFSAAATSLNREFIPFVGRQSLVVEAWAADGKITHRLLIPWQIAEHVTSELRHIIPGTIVEKTSDENFRPHPAWDDVVEIGLSDKERTIKTDMLETTKKDIQSALAHALQDGEKALIQWVISPVGHELPPGKDAPLTSSRWGMMSGLLNIQASDEERADRAKKVQHPRYYVIGRLAGRANTASRARQVVQDILDAIRTANGHARFTGTGPRLEVGRDNVNYAVTPMIYPATLNALELVCVSGLPLGSPTTPGYSRQMSRPFFATAEVVSSGNLFGTGTHPESKRRIAQSWEYPSHTVVIGKTGAGKSAFLDSCARQVMERGNGLVVMDATSSVSPETLFNRVATHVPANRLKDVYVMNFAASADHAVALNLLDQGDPYVLIDQLVAVIRGMYPDGQDVWTRQLIHHGLSALIEYGNASVVDLLALFRPNRDEVLWANKVKKSIKNKQIRRWFEEEWEPLTDQDKRKHSQPLHDRFWQLINRPEIFNVLGQSKSAFSFSDILANNKILLINLVGLPEETKGLVATLIFQTLWKVAQTMKMEPGKENYVFADEIQVMTKMDANLHDIMEQGRKHGFMLTTSTQAITNTAINKRVRDAIVNNAGTRVLFTTQGMDEANFWSSQFGGLVTAKDLQYLDRYNAIAQINGKKRMSEPVSFTSIDPRTIKQTYTSEHVIQWAGEKYGTPVAQLEKEVDARRMVAQDTKPMKPLWRRQADQTKEGE